VIDITVIRGAGDISGEVLSDPLIETEVVAIERGRNVIDSQAKVRSVTIETVFRPGIKTGMTIEVLDALQGLVWRGKIQGVDIAVEGVSTTMSLRVERYDNN
jgi:hypothetical protein